MSVKSGTITTALRLANRSILIFNHTYPLRKAGRISTLNSNHLPYCRNRMNTIICTQFNKRFARNEGSHT